MPLVDLCRQMLMGQDRMITRICISRVQPFETSWTVALQVPLAMGFPKQEYWGR